MRGTAEDKCRLVMSVARLPWPAPDAPSIDDVKQVQKHRQRGPKRAEEETNDKEDVSSARREMMRRPMTRKTSARQEER